MMPWHEISDDAFRRRLRRHAWPWTYNRWADPADWAEALDAHGALLEMLDREPAGSAKRKIFNREHRKAWTIQFGDSLSWRPPYPDADDTGGES